MGAFYIIPALRYTMQNQTWVCYTDSAQRGMLSIQLRRTPPVHAIDDQRCQCRPLPTGCLVEIFKHLDCYRSLTRCSMVCKEWQSAAADSRLHSRLCLRPDSRPHSRQRSTRSAEAAAVLSKLAQQQLVSLEIGTAHNRYVPIRVSSSSALSVLRYPHSRC